MTVLEDSKNESRVISLSYILSKGMGERWTNKHQLCHKNDRKFTMSQY